MRISDRIRNLERKTHIDVLPDLVIEVLEDGMVEIYGDKEGEKVRMTEAEYFLGEAVSEEAGSDGYYHRDGRMGFRGIIVR